MSRDVKHGSRGRGGKSGSKGSTLVGIFVGMVLGILIALAVVWYMNRQPSPVVERPSVSNGPASELKPGAPGVASAPAGSGEKRFQFYEILPGKAEPKPDAAPGTADKAPAKAAAEGKAAEPAPELFLQAGSFQTAKDADNLKASLALMGQEASVQQVMLADKVWYRVRLGPFAKPEAASKVKADLAKAGVEATLVRGRD